MRLRKRRVSGLSQALDPKKIKKASNSHFDGLEIQSKSGKAKSIITPKESIKSIARPRSNITSQKSSFRNRKFTSAQNLSPVKGQSIRANMLGVTEEEVADEDNQSVDQISS